MHSISLYIFTYIYNYILLYVYIYSIIVVYTQFLVVINLFHREFNGIQWNLYIHDVWIPDVEWMIIPHII
jgi:hypothetical protein